MAKKLKILYYSDCTFFAGCENMIASFLNNEDLNNRYDVCFLYCLSEAYTAGLNGRVAVEGKSIMSIKLPRPNRVHDYFKQKIANRKLRMIISAPIMWIWKYYCVFFSIYPLYKKLKPLQIDVLHINNGGYPAAVSCYAMVFVASILRIKKVVYVVNNIAEGYKNPLRWLDWGLDQW
uniref:hypothetical protein n=1 Tax=Pedobacter sp. ASV12 TaxID=2795120 RepID=UPI0018ECE2D7